MSLLFKEKQKERASLLFKERRQNKNEEEFLGCSCDHQMSNRQAHF